MAPPPIRSPLRSTLPLLLLASSACSGPEPQGAHREPAPELAPGVEAISLLGEELRTPELPAEVTAEREAELAAARAEAEGDPQSIDAAIWLGRRLAYLGRYREAIAVFTDALDRHPQEPRLYRHRGHRFITTRQLERAVADLERAAELVRDRQDRVERDGLPNPRGIPTSTLHTNIWYHLGLAHYLLGDFGAAEDPYRQGLAASTSNDMRVATSHWLYMTLRRLGRDEEAAAILEPIDAATEVIENHDYHRLLLLYRGELPVAQLWPGDADELSSATVGYGVGNWHLYSGREREATAVFRTILEGGEWAAFGFIAAEAELAPGMLSSIPSASHI